MTSARIQDGRPSSPACSVMCFCAFPLSMILLSLHGFCWALCSFLCLHHSKKFLPVNWDKPLVVWCTISRRPCFSLPVLFCVCLFVFAIVSVEGYISPSVLDGNGTYTLCKIQNGWISYTCALGNLRRDHEFEASLGNVAIPCHQF